jgi:catenin alpha
MADHFGPITLKWDPKNLEIRTMSVEKTLEPLVLQVSLLLGPAAKVFWTNRICKQFYINL